MSLVISSQCFSGYGKRPGAFGSIEEWKFPGCGKDSRVESKKEWPPGQVWIALLLPIRDQYTSTDKLRFRSFFRESFQFLFMTILCYVYNNFSVICQVSWSCYIKNIHIYLSGSDKVKLITRSPFGPKSSNAMCGYLIQPSALSIRTLSWLEAQVKA